MAERYLSKAALESHPGLEGSKLASPRRRLAHDRIAQTVVVHKARRV